MALSIQQVFRKLTKDQEIAKKYVTTFAPYQYRIFAERNRISQAHVDEVNAVAEQQGFFLFLSSNGTLFFGRDENFRPSVFEAGGETDGGMAL